VRHYSIKLINGVTTFTCPRCKHSVTTPDFSIQNGSLRTQAARAMNEHAAAVHNNPLPMYPRDAQMWHARYNAHTSPRLTARENENTFD
jgi:hypothetical protein